MSPFPHNCPIIISKCINGWVVSRADVKTDGVKDVMVFGQEYELTSFVREHFSQAE